MNENTNKLLDILGLSNIGLKIKKLDVHINATDPRCVTVDIEGLRIDEDIGKAVVKLAGLESKAISSISLHCSAQREYIGTVYTEVGKDLVYNREGIKA